MYHSVERHAGRSLQHLTTAYGGASPQGEAFERFASKSYMSQYGCQILAKGNMLHEFF